MSPLTLSSIAVSGLLDGVNPCAFSVLLSLAALLMAGVAFGRAQPPLWRVGGAYVAGMFATYLLLGLGLLSAVSFLTRTHLPVRLMGLVVVILGLWMIKDAVLPGWGWHLGMPARFHGTVRRALARTTPVGLLIAGGLVGLCTVPCSGAIYLGVLGLLAGEPLPARLAYLLLYNIAFIAPLILLLALIANRRILNRIGHWYLPRRSWATGALGTLAVALGFAILLTT
ncbi:MAG: hypothetical protein QN141_03640 [Armatimonadota bacterium]|nr:hypothetical protein [Armatimonadota bacterium]MDR7451437.1 hypothetical protein [Armatimonadota bacterium]MDR7466413.1 hypothetical protein [Armatimonadota bacterium]MDR7493135.1 hypothetical protein [Armatimonadota bacterium]MDR7498108.1 hypothetical protein [Armatimonadota bacterium]